MATKHTHNRSLRIGVDMAAATGQKSGLGMYIHEMATAIEQQNRSNPDQQTIDLVKIERIKNNLRTPQRILWDQIGVPLATIGKKLDALWVPAFSAPRTRLPIVMTAHDIFGVHYPEHFSQPARWYWATLLPQSMRRAKQLLCVSEYTKNDIVQQLNIPDSRCTVIPLAASEDFHVMQDAAPIHAALNKLNLDRPFILSVGTVEPRKNYARLIEAFAFAERGDAQLVIVGKAGWKTDEVTAVIEKYHLQDTVRFLQYVSQGELIALYNACLFFVMPSIFEGFGLPALEAMQCGAPVAVAQNTSLPEVVGDAGVLFDPFSIDSIRERLNLLFTNSEIRSEMQQHSVQQAKQFSWTKTAEQSINVLKHGMM